MEQRNFPAGRTAFYRYDLSGQPRAVILLVHGLGEHAGRYEGWSARFNDNGMALYSFDLPGHGLSEGRRGVIPSPDKVFDTISEISGEINTSFPGVPLFLYGHSLGGGLILSYLVQRRPDVAGAVVTSPWVILSDDPPAIKILLARVAGWLMPGLVQSSGLKSSHLSRDPEVVEQYRNDPLVHGKISAALYNRMSKAAAATLERAGEITVPLLLVHGRNDKITSSSGSVMVAEAAPKATLKLWDEGYHELHNDPLKEEHFRFIVGWIETLI